MRSEWNVPGYLNTEGISPVDKNELPDIAKILREDNEDYLAEEFQKEHPKFTPEHVILAMKSEGEIIAIGYYYVQPFKDKSMGGKTYDGLGAWSTGIHFRPKYSVPHKEKRRFIEAVLASMKQLNVIFASGRVSSRDYDKFIELLSSGFQFHGDTPSTIQNRMCRKV